MLFANIFSLSVAIFESLGDVFYRAKRFNLMKFNWSIISFMDSAWGLDLNSLRKESPTFLRKYFLERMWAFSSESILKLCEIRNKGKNVQGKDIRGKDKLSFGDSMKPWIYTYLSQIPPTFRFLWLNISVLF